LVLQVTEESPDRDEPGVACAGAVAAAYLNLVKKSEHQIRIKILDPKIARSPVELPGREPD
jgi:hypothetical protein